MRFSCGRGFSRFLWDTFPTGLNETIPSSTASVKMSERGTIAARIVHPAYPFRFQLPNQPGNLVLVDPLQRLPPERGLEPLLHVPGVHVVGEAGAVRREERLRTTQTDKQQRAQDTLARLAARHASPVAARRAAPTRARSRSAATPV
jgi:hypothetical protein